MPCNSFYHDICKLLGLDSLGWQYWMFSFVILKKEHLRGQLATFIQWHIAIKYNAGLFHTLHQKTCKIPPKMHLLLQNVYIQDPTSCTSFHREE